MTGTALRARCLGGACEGRPIFGSGTKHAPTEKARGITLPLTLSSVARSGSINNVDAALTRVPTRYGGVKCRVGLKTTDGKKKSVYGRRRRARKEKQWNLRALNVYTTRSRRIYYASR